MDPELQAIARLIALQQKEAHEYEPTNLPSFLRSHGMKQNVERARDIDALNDVWYPPHFQYPRQPPTLDEQFLFDDEEGA